MNPPRARRGLLLLVFLLGAPGVHAVDSPSLGRPADGQRQADVARRGADVMPFDLARTTHVFTKTASGGTQRVVVKDAGDVEQVRLVREHLRAVGAQFERRDFSAPEQIHGRSMAGLEALRRAPQGAVAVRYADLPDGAMLVYSSRDPKLVSALHRWFDAQVSDHGADAEAGPAHADHRGHSMHRP